MALIRNRKGMLSSLDAMIFLSVMVLVSAGLFAYASFEDPETITSKDVADSFFSAELRASDLYPTEDDQTAPICDILAACINSESDKGEGDTEKVMRIDTQAQLVLGGDGIQRQGSDCGRSRLRGIIIL